MWWFKYWFSRLDIKEKSNNKSKKHRCKYFQYAATVALNYEESESHLERVSNIKTFTNEYNWKRTNYPSKIDYWKTFEKNNLTIALNILYIKDKKILPVYVSKHNSTREKQIILSAIPNEEKEGWHYLAVKNYLHYYME